MPFFKNLPRDLKTSFKKDLIPLECDFCRNVCTYMYKKVNFSAEFHAKYRRSRSLRGPSKYQLRMGNNEQSMS